MPDLEEQIGTCRAIRNCPELTEQVNYTCRAIQNCKPEEPSRSSNHYSSRQDYKLSKFQSELAELVLVLQTVAVNTHSQQNWLTTMGWASCSKLINVYRAWFKEVKRKRKELEKNVVKSPTKWARWFQSSAAGGAEFDALIELQGDGAEKIVVYSGRPVIGHEVHWARP